MSSVFQRSLLKSETAAAWGIIQKSRGQKARAWAFFPGSNGILQAERAGDAEALEKKVQAAGGRVREVPEHWRCLPTGMDLQVHLRFPGQPHKETLEGGLESALVGGYDSIITMPNTQPYLDEPKALAEAIAAASPVIAGYPVRVGFTAAATRGMQGQEPTDVGALAAAGAVAITDDGWGVKSAEAQAALFAACRESDLLFQQHAEMPGHKGVATRSAFQQAENLPEYPRDAESGMVARDLALLRKIPEARYHVLHISTRETLAEIRRAKEEGLRVTAEVSPHHLLFANSDIPPATDERCSYFKMNPPLFAPEDRVALVAALKDGTIDCVSTDHAPHETELKRKGWQLGPFGTRGLETALPALLTLVARGDLGWERMVEVFSHAPRRVLGRSEYAHSSGLLFVDPAVSYRLVEADLPGISRNSCFLGAELHGRVGLRCEAGRIFAR
jgi:dihydroorotase